MNNDKLLLMYIFFLVFLSSYGAFAQVTIPPTVSQLSPNQGPVAGGITITVIGSNFSTFGQFLCQFGSYSSTGQLDRSVNPPQVLCPLPQSTFLGLVQFTLSSDGVTFSNPVSFRYNGGVPSIISLSPNVSVSSGGVTITVYGSNFALGFLPRCFFGNVSVTATIYTSQTATCVSPTFPGSSTVQNISFTFSNDNGTTFSNPLPFLVEIPLPVLQTISPGIGSPGSLVTLNGLYITPTGVATCLVGSTVVSALVIPSVSPLDPNQYRAQCPIPPLNSPRNRPIVEIKFSADGVNFSNPLTFTYIDPVPKISSVVPSIGSYELITQVTIKGAGFVNSTALKCIFGQYGPTNATILPNSNGGVIVCPTPYTGYQIEVRLRVTNDPSLLLKSNSLFFSFERPEFVLLGLENPQIPPVLTDILPKAGPVSGGTKVTIYGSGFLAGSRLSCSFGNSLSSTDVPASLVIFKDSAQVYCFTPPSTLAQPYLTSVFVTNDNYTYSNALPFRYILESGFIQYPDN